MHPLQAVLLQAKAPQDRRGDPERVEGAEHVTAEPGQGQLGCPDAPAGLAGRLEDLHLPAGIGEQVGRDQSVVAGPDHDGVSHAVPFCSPSTIDWGRVNSGPARKPPGPPELPSVGG
jgi:hypothetical protein